MNQNIAFIFISLNAFCLALCFTMSSAENHIHFNQALHHHIKSLNFSFSHSFKHNGTGCNRVRNPQMRISSEKGALLHTLYTFSIDYWRNET